MKKMLSVLTAALFAVAAIPSFAEEPVELYPAPPIEKSVDSAPKNKKAHQAKKIHKVKKANKTARHKARQVRKARR